VAIKRERVSVVCVYDHKILVFVAIDPTSGKRYYFLPGGGLEEGETEVACGIRETVEETGYRVIVEADSRLSKNYLFHWNGQHYDCVTHFYRGHLAEIYRPPKAVVDQDYNKGAVWMPVSKIHVIFDYSPEIHDAVEALIDS
jgi:8-oxo-dGTP pyrophosphatase MutT (NUDIX family)